MDSSFSKDVEGIVSLLKSIAKNPPKTDELKGNARLELSLAAAFLDCDHMAQAYRDKQVAFLEWKQAERDNFDGYLVTLESSKSVLRREAARAVSMNMDVNRKEAKFKTCKDIIFQLSSLQRRIDNVLNSLK